jgi:hypothetical protein
MKTRRGIHFIYIFFRKITKWYFILFLPSCVDACNPFAGRHLCSVLSLLYVLVHGGHGQTTHKWQRASHSFHTHLCSWPTQTLHIFFITDAKEKSMHRKFRVIGICSTHILTHYYYHELEPTKGLFWPSQEVHLRFSLAISFALLLHSTSSQFTWHDNIPDEPLSTKHATKTCQSTNYQVKELLNTTTSSARND